MPSKETPAKPDTNKPEPADIRKVSELPEGIPGYIRPNPSNEGE